MMSNMFREDLKAHAIQHVEEMQQYKSYTDYSVKNSVFYKANINTSPVNSNPYNGNIVLDSNDSVSALYKYANIYSDDNKSCVLNFASYKNPGGFFIGGSRAQEEALCHESNLYNILINFEQEFYKPNMNRLNNALYNDNLIYTPKVLFIRDGVKKMSDVITCAAPNKTTAVRYRNIDPVKIDRVMRSRIDHILFSAYLNSVKTLILGAYGCGVFGNNPYDVARIFADLLTTKYDKVFDDVIFPVPQGDNDNYRAFSEILNR